MNEDPDRILLQRRQSRVRYLLVFAGVITAAVAGYVGFFLYPQLDSTAEMGVGLLVLASGTGFAAFFSPCSFPLLLTLLGREVASDPTGARPPPRTIGFAAAMAMGASIFLVGFGAILALSGCALASAVTFGSPAGRALRVLVGAGLILLALIQIGVFRAGFGRVAALAQPIERARLRAGGRNRFIGNAVYGFGYLIAGFG